MVRRLAPFLVGLSILLAAFAAPASADDAPGAVAPALEVPDGPLAGEVSITLNVDPDVYPYLQLRLTPRGGGAPAVLGNGVSTPVFANAGVGMGYDLSTWGASGDTGVQLTGCTALNCAGSTAALDAAVIDVEQSDLPAAVVSAPDTTFLYPEQATPTVESDAPAGGSLRWAAWNTATTYRMRPLAAGTSTAVDLTGVTAISAIIGPVVCSPYGTSLCQPLASKTITFVSAVRDIVSPQAGQIGTTLITDPTMFGATARLKDGGPGLPYDAAWTLADASGTVVLGPVDIPGTETNRDFSLNPEALASGTLPDGTYTLAVANTVAIDGQTKSATFTIKLTLETDPPAYPVPTPVVNDNILRVPPYGFGSMADTDTDFVVPSLDTMAGPATFKVANARGTIVYTSTLPAVSQQEYVEDDRRPYEWRWDGYRATGGQPLPAGIYTASATIPDHYGRQVVVPLGRIDDYSGASTSRRIATSVSVHLRVPHHGATSRVFRLRMPANAGNVVSLWPEVRASSRGGYGEFRIAVRVPSLGTRWVTDKRYLGHAWLDPSWSSGAGWQNLGAHGDHPGLVGRIVEVRVTLPHQRHLSAVDVTRVRLHIDGWRWSLT